MISHQKINIPLFNSKIKIQPVYLDIIFLMGLVLFLYLIFQPSFANPMVFDTPLNLNQKAFENVPQNFSLKSIINSSRHIVFYSFYINYYFYGMGPYTFRVVNLVVHMLNACLMYVFLYQLFLCFYRDKKEISFFTLKKWAMIGSFLFAMSPVGMYAVVYIVQRYLLVSTLFSLLSLSAFMLGINKGNENKFNNAWLPRSKWYLVSVLFYFLAVHSKEHAVLLPVLIFSIYYLKNGLDIAKWKSMLLPFLLYAFIGGHTVYILKWLVATVYEPNANLAIGSMLTSLPEINHKTLNDPTALYIQSIVNQCWLYFRYLYLWLIPDVSKMALDLPLPFVLNFWAWPNVLGLFGIITYVVLAIFAILKRNAFSLLGLSLLFPIVLFLTEFSTIRMHENFVLYRSYIWMIGLFIILPYFLKPLNIQSIWVWPRRLLVGLYCLSFVLALHHNLKPLKTGLSLWQDVVDKIDLTDKTVPSSYRSAGNLGTALGNTGKIDEAIKYYRASINLNANYVKSWDGLGAALSLKGDYLEGEKALLKALEIEPQYKEAYYNLGTTYTILKQPEKAIVLYNKALLIDPKYEQVLYNLANTYLKLNKSNLALDIYHKLVTYYPNHYEGFHNLGIAYTQLGKHTEAINEYLKVIKINPLHPKAYFNIANSYAALNDYVNAYKSYSKAIQIGPANIIALHNAGLMLLKLGKQQDALKYFKQVVKIKPGFVPSEKMIIKLTQKI
ncbi:hypothetical protein BVY03_03055 [bacterium K02(2017)]|nr:hypothetical protein BVY03_03055 [bacterium K02(2017)]